MDKIKALFGLSKVNKKFIRDSKGRPYYLVKLPFSKRYPLTFIFGGGILATCITFSGIIYSALFTKPGDCSPDDFLWNRERETGMTNLERVRKAYPKPNPAPKIVETTG